MTTSSLRHKAFFKSSIGSMLIPIDDEFLIDRESLLDKLWLNTDLGIFGIGGIGYG